MPNGFWVNLANGKPLWEIRRQGEARALLLLPALGIERSLWQQFLCGSTSFRKTSPSVVTTPAEAAPTMVIALSGGLLQHPPPPPFDLSALQATAADPCSCSSLYCLMVPSALPTFATNSLHDTTWHGLCFSDWTLSLVKWTSGL